MGKLIKYGAPILLALGIVGLGALARHDKHKKEALDEMAAATVFEHYDSDNNGRWSQEECRKFYDDIGCEKRLPSGEVTSLRASTVMFPSTSCSRNPDGTYNASTSDLWLREKASKISGTSFW